MKVRCVEEATLSNDGRVTIPKRIRERMGMRPGQKLQFFEQRETVLIRKAPDHRDAVDRAWGRLKQLDKTTDQVMRELRGESDLP
jgi:antitoxin PrlF